jgi:DNA-binding transcriptional MerR regulator
MAETDESMGKIGELARETGLTVRTLRHYDQLGLLSPSARTAGGHRSYTGGDGHHGRVADCLGCIADRPE